MPTEAVPMASIRSKLNLASLLWGQLQLILLFNQDMDFIQFVCDSVSLCPFAFENLFLKELDYYNENWLWICPAQYLILGSIYFQTGYNLQITLWREQSGFVRYFMAEIKSQLVVQNVILVYVNIRVIFVDIYMQDEGRENQKATKYITVWTLIGLPEKNK